MSFHWYWYAGVAVLCIRVCCKASPSGWLVLGWRQSSSVGLVACLKVTVQFNMTLEVGSYGVAARSHINA